MMRVRIEPSIRREEFVKYYYLLLVPKEEGEEVINRLILKY